MKLSKARLEPIPETQWSDKVKETLREIKVGQGGVPNIFKTLAHHPDLMRRWLVFGNHVLFKSTLPARERELVILRIGYWHPATGGCTEQRAGLAMLVDACGRCKSDLKASDQKKSPAGTQPRRAHFPV